MVKKLWQGISSIGIKPGYNEKKIKRVTQINQYTVIALLMYVINGLSDFALGFMREGIMFELAAFVFIFALYLNRIHQHKATVVFLFVFISLTIFYFGVLAGMQSGYYLYYFPLMLAISFAFDFSKDKVLMSSLFVFILLLVFLNTIAYAEFPVAPEFENNRYRMFVVNLILSVITIGFFIYFTAKNNDEMSGLYEQRLRDKEESENVVKKTLHEKEVLLAELHHRVKNNLAVMAGFFNLQLNQTNNEEARSVLMESRNRVNSMALIHNHLYRKEDFSEINFSSYIMELVNEIKTSYPSISKSVHIHSNIANIRLNLNSAVPCALILNELLTNCYKHAFKNRDEGYIRIDFNRSGEGMLKLVVQDDGPGLSADFDKRGSMGISVIEALSQQLNGTQAYSSNKGTKFELLFDPVKV